MILTGKLKRASIIRILCRSNGKEKLSIFKSLFLYSACAFIFTIIFMVLLYVALTLLEIVQSKDIIREERTLYAFLIFYAFSFYIFNNGRLERHKTFLNVYKREFPHDYKLDLPHGEDPNAWDD